MAEAIEDPLPPPVIAEAPDVAEEVETPVAGQPEAPIAEPAVAETAAPEPPAPAPVAAEPVSDEPHGREADAREPVPEPVAAFGDTPLSAIERLSIAGDLSPEIRRRDRILTAAWAASFALLAALGVAAYTERNLLMRHWPASKRVYATLGLLPADARDGRGMRGTSPEATSPAATSPVGTVPSGTDAAGSVPTGSVPAATAPAGTGTAATGTQATGQGGDATHENAEAVAGQRPEETRTR